MLATAVQVAHGAPGGAQALGGYVQRAGQEVVVGGSVGGRDLVERFLGLGQQLGDGGLDVRRIDRGEIGQRRGGEQGVAAGDAAAGAAAVESVMQAS